MSLAGAAATPLWFWFFDLAGRILSYRPVAETGFRQDRQIKRGRK